MAKVEVNHQRETESVCEYLTPCGLCIKSGKKCIKANVTREGARDASNRSSKQ